MTTYLRPSIAGVFALVVWASPSLAQPSGVDSAFRWSGRVAPTAGVVVRTLYGKVRVESGDVDEVQVRASKSWRTGDPGPVAVRVSRIGPDSGGVLVCGVWPGETLDCSETSYVVNNDGRNDTRLDFVVIVPRGTSVTAESINGEVQIVDVGGAATGSTVNGRVVIGVRPDADADIEASTLNGNFKSDVALGPYSQQTRRSTRARLGAGGRAIRLVSVNGTLRLVPATAVR